MKLHRVYYKEFSRTDKISIDNKSKINHLRNVLRLKEGSKLDVFDGEGNSSICKIVSLEKKKDSIGTDWRHCISATRENQFKSFNALHEKRKPFFCYPKGNRNRC